jgi:hypothetical protein
VTARRGQPKEPEPLVQGQGGSTTCIPRFGEEHLTLGYSSLRNTSDSSIVGDDVRLQHGYPPRFSYREGKIACRHRRPGPGSTVAPGEVLDIVLHVRKTTPGRAHLDTRVVEYHDADGRSYTWRDHSTVILRGGDSCF